MQTLQLEITAMRWTPDWPSLHTILLSSDTDVSLYLCHMDASQSLCMKHCAGSSWMTWKPSSKLGKLNSRNEKAPGGRVSDPPGASSYVVANLCPIRNFSKNSAKSLDYSSGPVVYSSHDERCMTANAPSHPDLNKIM